MVNFSWTFVLVIITYGFGISNQATWSQDINYSPTKIYYPGPVNRPDSYKYKTSTTTTPKPSVTNNVQGDAGDDEETCILTATPPDPDSQCCGIEASSNNFIVGGEATTLEQYPWLVAIEYKRKDDGKMKVYCGGFLISGRYMLSAAHCFVGEVEQVGKPQNILLGEYNVTNEGPDCIKTKAGATVCTKGATRVPIESVVVHPEHYHDTRVNYHDIAIVRLSKTVEYSNYVRPICLPKSDLEVSPLDNLMLYTTGWGAIKQRRVNFGFFSEYDGIKRHVAVPYRNITACREVFGSFVGEGHMCAGGEQGKDSCRGDSGGPLMRESDGVFSVIGMVSTGTGKHACGTEGFPAIYVKIYQYLDWIRSNIKP
ncbi:phenoloxidase-activating enzyme-like [Pectinophora gossypiella]|uniref:phenoloxidase-activating enzyme-like n=1 Tax=Pectinophora gossypiella TaxID=13191 RepID=UPI00214F4237|nr:phenoloxidase-activating enzyme-like [Pectinophora gossypiella]